jgi:hypothetical protein
VTGAGASAPQRPWQLPGQSFGCLHGPLALQGGGHCPRRSALQRMLSLVLFRACSASFRSPIALSDLGRPFHSTPIQPFHPPLQTRRW